MAGGNFSDPRVPRSTPPSPHNPLVGCRTGGRALSESKILLGFEVGTGAEVRMKLHHTVVTGMTQLSGKTTALEALISRSNLRAIAFKTKRGEAGFSSYRDIRPFFIEQSDWRYVSSLLEAMLRERMKFERSWIIKATKGTKTLREVLHNVSELKEKARKDSLTESVYVTLEEYLFGIVPQIEKFHFSKELNLADGINVMDLSSMSLEMRSLVIRSVMEHVINNLSNIIVIIPEAWEYIPQGRGTPVKLYAETFIRKGAAIGNYLFVDSQDIAGIDKTPLRSCDNWIMGRQKETHEVDRFREVIGKSVSEEEIKLLPIGHFIAYLGNEIKKVYVLPAGVPEEVGRRVALGELSPEYVKDNYLLKKEGDEELVWKEKFEEEKRKREECEKEFARQLEHLVEKARQEAFSEAMKKVDEIKKQWHVEEYQQTIAQMKDEKAMLEAALKQLEPLKAFKEALINFLGAYAPKAGPPGFEPGSSVPSEMHVVTEQPTLTVKVERKTVELTDKTTEGKIAIIYAEGKLSSGKWFTTTDVVNAFVSHGWPRDPRIGPTLDKMCSWGFFEKHYAGKRPEYRLKMKVEDARSKGLLKEVMS